MRTNFNPLDVEQYMMELVNRARLDPLAEATRQGIDLNFGIAPNSISTDTKAPLSFNTQLIEAAYDHSVWMLDTDIFSHTGINNSNPGERMVTAGYGSAGTFGWGENISFGGTTGTYDLNEYVKDRHDRLFLSQTGHRENLMFEGHAEAGFGIAEGVFTSEGTGYNSVMATQNFATKNPSIFLTGVVFNDLDGDDFYTPGEGTDAIAVTFKQASSGSFTNSTQYSTGGWSATASSGDWNVTFSGGALAQSIELTVALAGESGKVDLINESWIHASTDITLGANADRLIMLGRDNLTATGNDARNKIFGNKGDNIIHAGAGNDLVDGGNGNDTLYANSGFDELYGGRGADTLYASADGGWMSGGNGNDTLVGNNGKDRIWGGDGDDTISGGSHLDRIKGGDGNDIINGGDHADLLIGGNQNDTLNGDEGNDYLYGEGDNDTLNGGAGNDVLLGGDGLDVFVFDNQSDSFGRDKIRDFDQAFDLIDLRNVVSVNDFSDLVISQTQWAATKIKFDADNLIYIENFDAANLEAADFIF